MSALRWLDQDPPSHGTRWWRMILAQCSLGQRRVCPSLQWMGTLTELELAPCHLIPLVPPSVQCMCVWLLIQWTVPRPVLLSMCMVSAAKRKSIRFSLFSFVSDITSYVPEGGRYVVNVTDTVTFQCRVTGFPPPTIQWFRGTQPLDPATDSRISLSEHQNIPAPVGLSTVERTLTISNVTANDTAEDYRCTATNIATDGMDTETFELFVQGRVTLVFLTMYYPFTFQFLLWLFR